MTLDNKRSIFGWAMYDWANSVYATTVMAVFFPLFFNDFWSFGADTNITTARLGIANSVAGIIVALIAPLLGAIADKAASRVKFLIGFLFLGALMSMSLFMVSKGNWVAATALYVVATIGFSGGNIFYDALITGVASPQKMNFVSSFGFSLGYLGGGILLIINAVMYKNYYHFGFATAEDAVQFFFLMVGIWWIVFSIPLLLWVKEPDGSKEKSERKVIVAGLKQLKTTLTEIRNIKTIGLFLLAYWIYIDGVDTIIRMAIDYGLSIGLVKRDLIAALIITQFVGFPFAIIFGWLGNKVGTKRTILISVFVYFVISIWGAFMQSEREFYIMAFSIGIVQGGIQALSRSYFAKMVPTGRSAEYFGFYNMIGKFAAVLGPVFVGAVGLLVRYLGYSSDTATRTGIGSISIFFIVGGVLLYFVDENKGKLEAKRIDRR